MSTVTIDDNQVRQLLSDTRARSKFPFMNTAYLKIKSGRSGCGTCGKKKTNNKSEYDNVKRAIGLMPEAQKRELLKLLGAKAVKVNFVHNGKPRSVKFS